MSLNGHGREVTPFGQPVNVMRPCRTFAADGALRDGRRPTAH